MASKFQWLPFGGGAHKCIGLHFSYIQSKIFLRALLLRFRVVPATSEKTEWFHIPFPHPKQSFRLIPLEAKGAA
jgi:cytochrome P450